jgi:hypothetical protein
MKSKLMVGSLASALLMGMLSSVMAQNTNTPGIDRAQQEIGARIEQGLASGRISPSEAQALHRREREIQYRENRSKADQYASPEERQQLRQDLEALRGEVERLIAAPRAIPQQSDNTPGIDRSQQEISVRIQDGLASGHITPSEAQTLHRREREIEARENRYKADRNASPEERQQLRQDLAALRAEVERIIANPRAIPQQSNNTPGIDERESTIADRIEDGVSSDRITEREARRLHRREREIARHEARFKADGIVTIRERRQLRNELAALRDDVERMMRR